MYIAKCHLPRLTTLAPHSVYNTNTLLFRIVGGVDTLYGSVHIAAITPEGPAQMSEKLSVGDRITKLGPAKYVLFNLSFIHRRFINTH